MTEAWEEGYDELDPPGTDWRTVMAILSLVVGCTGALSWCCFGPLSIPFGLGSIVMGVLGLRSPQRGLAIAGIVVGALVLLGGLAILAVFVVAFAAEM